MSVFEELLDAALEAEITDPAVEAAVCRCLVVYGAQDLDVPLTAVHMAIGEPFVLSDFEAL